MITSFSCVTHLSDFRRNTSILICLTLNVVDTNTGANASSCELVQWWMQLLITNEVIIVTIIYALIMNFQIRFSRKLGTGREISLYIFFHFLVKRNQLDSSFGRTSCIFITDTPVLSLQLQFPAFNYEIHSKIYSHAPKSTINPNGTFFLVNQLKGDSPVKTYDFFREFPQFAATLLEMSKVQRWMQQKYGERSTKETSNYDAS